MLALIEGSSKSEPAHRFSEPRSFDGVELVGQYAGFDRLPSLGKPFVDWFGKAERVR